jgi:hypothetical protein
VIIGGMSVGTFAVDAVVAEIDARLGKSGTRVGAGLKEVDANNEFVELLATVELMNRYAASELLSGGQPSKAGTPSRSLSDEVIDRLKKWILRIREILLKLAQALQAKAWSVAVGFPWNIVLSMEFGVPKP